MGKVLTDDTMRKWVTLCKRTDDPKLEWLELTLALAGIETRRNGRSFHAPILEVRASDEDAAWAVLNPIDDIPDDARRWSRELPALRAEVAEEGAEDAEASLAYFDRYVAGDR